MERETGHAFYALAMTLSGGLIWLGPPLSHLWGVDIVTAGDVILSVPRKKTSRPANYSRPLITYVVNAEEKAIHFWIYEHRAYSPRSLIPRREWEEDGAVRKCTGKLDSPSVIQRLIECETAISSHPLVSVRHPNLGGGCLASFPVSESVVARAIIPPDMVDHWGHIAHLAAYYLESMEASPIEQIYAKTSAFLSQGLAALATILGSLVLVALYLPIVVFPLVPALWLARKRREMQPPDKIPRRRVAQKEPESGNSA